MPKRLLVNDCLSALPDHRTFWHDLMEWFDMEFADGDYKDLKHAVESGRPDATLIVRNATWFPPIISSAPQISLLQDIFADGPVREMQDAVIASSARTVFNSEFTASKYPCNLNDPLQVKRAVIPLPVDFRTFEPGNAMGLQQALSLPQGCVLWVGASQGAAGQIKGYDIFLSIVRQNPDIPFVAVFKDSMPEYAPTNLRMYCRLTHDELARVIGACSVGLCTSRMESQHLAGIEMGACGLPLVVPEVGTYWQREEMPGTIVMEGSPANYSSALRSIRMRSFNPESVRSYWSREFLPITIRDLWAELIKEVECSGAS